MNSYSKEYYQELKKGSLQSAREVVPLVLELIQPRHIIDVGCGLGIWLSVFKEFGVEEIWGVDGEWVNKDMLSFSREQFLSTDLGKPFRIDRQFDLVVSLEVAEHLPIECAETFVDSLTGLGPVILFSAAPPFQGGTNHLNEQWPDYWANYFLNKGYLTIDCLRKKLWQKDNVEWWYIQNILFFVRKDCLENYPLLKREYEHTALYPLSIVHPRPYLELQQHVAEFQKWVAELQEWVAELQALKPGRVSLKKVLLALPALTKHALYRKIDRLFSKKNSEL
ncbi:MAG: class I SAM-dependent methyltransferase [Thermodesulfobacteriota bacterium]